MLSRERVTYFSQIATDEEIKLKHEFIFKAKGSGKIIKSQIDNEITEDLKEQVEIQFSESGSYKEKQMLETIEHLPHLSTPFTKQTL